MKLKKILIAALLGVACCGGSAWARVYSGLEVLRQHNFDVLRGKRVGLITNPTGVDAELRSTVDILNDAEQVKLTALFAPEHGVRGDVAAGASVASQTDSRTGLTVYSLYGRTRKPTVEMLKGVDALVYDIQDNGCRSYTFISTLGKAMEACREQGKEMIVLDRPNPLGGERVEGCITTDDCISFVSQFRIPYIYGLTVGELAQWINQNVLGGEVNLTVVPMQGWERSMTYEQTELPWVATSPNMPTAATAMFYPATGILGELGVASIGANYTMPFRVVCNAWVDADRLAECLTALRLDGVMFRPVHITPPGSKTRHGVEIYISDIAAVESLTLLQFYVMQELAAMAPERAAFKESTADRLSMFDKVCGSKEVRRLFQKNYHVADILDYWQKDADEFRKSVEKLKLY
jgi:uncharacterized protein YbbC (DUF1343 family)